MKNRIILSLIGMSLAASLAACTANQPVSNTETNSSNETISNTTMENQPKTYPIVATVSEIKPDAFHESYDDGFLILDAIFLKVESPEDFPEEALAIYVAKWELDSLSWIQPGAQMKFSFDAGLLNSSQLFLGALEGVEEVKE